MKRTHLSAFWFALVSIILLTFSVSLAAQSAATADLRGVVKDPAAAVIPNATVTVRDDARGFERSVQSDAQGEFQFLSLPPGNYTVTVQAAGFSRLLANNVRLTVGQVADLPLDMKVTSAVETVNVTSEAALVETAKTSLTTTVDQRTINDLPINERNYQNFALITSVVNRDNGRPIGPAPTSGLNIGGQRGRSTLVSVDGADNTDTSVNASRSTLSQEAVQEFQVITNSYAAEFGRASGGVINVISKSGTNDYRGNLFGFLRHRSFQAKNALAPVEDPPFTRVQYGATFGGPIVKNKTFFFAAFEQRRRQESGFFTTDVSSGLNATASIPTIAGLNLPGVTFSNITAAQATYITNLFTTGAGLLGNANPALRVQGAKLVCGARAYGYFASSGGITALTALNTLAAPNAGIVPATNNACDDPLLGGSPFSPISPATGATIGGRFLLSGAPVPLTVLNGQPIAFRPLTQLQKVFPISEGTTYTSLRLDHLLSPSHQLSLRGGFNPSMISGIQVESQNQALGQNDFSRTGIQNFRDISVAASLMSTLSTTTVNELRFNYGRRAAAFRSQSGDAVAANISGTAFLGRELFSPVHRVERRYQIADNISKVWGNHNLKFGGDLNFVSINATFELNFAGLFNFGGLSASTLSSSFATAPGCTPGAINCAPDFTPVQQYGLGFPSSYIQGFGDPRSSLGNKPIAFFAQDSWKIRPNLTLNYGVRYDVELTKQITPVGFTDPLSGIVLSADDIIKAQDAVNGRQGFPRDYNNIAPRLAIAWDPWSNNKTVIRAAWGMFYDHPLGAVAFNSDIADAVQQQQFVALPGSPSPSTLLNAVQIFQGTVSPTTPGVATGAQYQFGRQRFNDQTFPGFGPILPFVLPVAKDFQYAYTMQSHFGIEQQLTRDMSLSVAYLGVQARHLPRPQDVNSPQNDLLIANFRRYAGAAVDPTSTTDALLVNRFPATAPGSTFTNPYNPAETLTVIVPGFIVVGPRGKVVNPFAANVFRPNAPNYFLVKALTGLSPAAFDAQLAGTLRTPGVVSPFGAVDEQVSNANSSYHALNAELKKRFSHQVQFLASYTWSHAIDESSDLQTLLLPQDNRNLRAERANSLFDQRHRFVFSSILGSPESWRGSSGFTRFLTDFSIAPIIEISSGRPFNILSNQDSNNDQSNQTDRPDIGAGGVLVIPNLLTADKTNFSTGNLGRNAGITKPFASVDLRVTRVVRFGDHMRLDLIAEGFNLINRFNQAASSPFFTDVNATNHVKSGHYFSRPTAAFDPRQFQFGVKLNF